MGSEQNVICALKKKKKKKRTEAPYGARGSATSGLWGPDGEVHPPHTPTPPPSQRKKENGGRQDDPRKLIIDQKEKGQSRGSFLHRDLSPEKNEE